MISIPRNASSSQVNFLITASAWQSSLTVKGKSTIESQEIQNKPAKGTER